MPPLTDHGLLTLQSFTNIFTHELTAHLLQVFPVIVTTSREMKREAGALIQDSGSTIPALPPQR